MIDSQIIESLLTDITTKDWGIIPNFLPIATAIALKQDLLCRQEAGQFKQAGVGKAGTNQIRTDIRGDETMWWQESDLVEAQKNYYQNINTLKEALNQAFFLHLAELECHYACYPTGAYYKRHVDSFRKNNSRLISVILYLNEDWQASKGGNLRIYNPDNESFIDILPTQATLICMRSDTVSHEVLPATQARYSIAGWLRRQDTYF